MDLKPILATSLGTAIYRGAVSPLIQRYLAWRNGTGVQIARRNWRGVYVPDVQVERGEWLFWLTVLAFVALGAAVDWTLMVGS
jgi:hypothetical protein